VASVAINMPLQKELFASSRLPRRRVQDAYISHFPFLASAGWLCYHRAVQRRL